MTDPFLRNEIPRAQLFANRAFARIERLLHIEAFGGAVLLTAAIIALIWANSPLAPTYHDLWHAPLSIQLGEYAFSQSLHFWVNDALMTIFFLVVGMEIRREMHDGALSSPTQAALPFAAAIGGVLFPALIYVAINNDPVRVNGWAVPTATDIAFAVGMLALLGKSIPANVRIFLLAVAIIDDIIAVLIIALFYSGGLDYSGFAVAGVGIALVIALQRIGIGSAYAYIVPGAVIWIGMLMTGAHPTLAGVVLGLMTPVFSIPSKERPLEAAKRAVSELAAENDADPYHTAHALKELRRAEREILPPAVRMQAKLHPWVAYAVMPIFALANAGVSMDGIDLSTDAAQLVILGVAIALIIGKPVGIILMSWIVIRLGWCRMPPGVTMSGICLIGLLAGIGFTMSIFISMLAFEDPALLGAAKLGVLLGSLVSAVFGLIWGVVYSRKMKQELVTPTAA